MTTRDPMPELCHHKNSDECTAECEEMIRKFDEWMRKQLKGDDDAHFDSPPGRNGDDR